MSDINIDTVKMRDCGKDIMNLAESLNGTIEAMFSRISNMQIRSEWIGDSSGLFTKLAEADKAQYIALKNSLYAYGSYLVDCAEQFEKTAREIKVD